MPDPSTYSEHARELLQRAATERDRGRQRYLRGLARSYEALAERQGESEPPEAPAVPERASLVALLRCRGFTEAHIARRLECSTQQVSQLMREAGQKY
jgi:hypothetical protein